MSNSTTKLHSLLCAVSALEDSWENTALSSTTAERLYDVFYYAYKHRGAITTPFVCKGVSVSRSATEKGVVVVSVDLSHLFRNSPTFQTQDQAWSWFLRMFTFSELVVVGIPSLVNDVVTVSLKHSKR